MKTITGKIFLLLISSLLIVACTSPAPAPAPIPTNPVSEPTSMGSNPAAVTGTEQPLGMNSTSQGLPTQNPSNPELIDYTHKKSFFRFKIPANWKVDEQESFTNITAPDDSGFIQVVAVNTGFELNELGFANFVDATEEYNFAKYINYSQMERTVDSKKGLATLQSTLDFNKIPQKILSIYQRQGRMVFYMHFWSNADIYETNGPLYEQISRSRFFDSAYAEELKPYSILYEFTGPNNLFAFKIPINWVYQNFADEKMIRDTFISPEGYASIQNITYDDGYTVTRGEADLIALELLKEIYAKDVRISEARTQADLSIRWTWASKSGGIEGTSFYETRGTSFLMLTLFCDKEYKNIFDPLFNRIIASYQLPER